MRDPSPRVPEVKVCHLRIMRKPNIARWLKDESLHSLLLSVLTVPIVPVGTELAALPAQTGIWAPFPNLGETRSLDWPTGLGMRP